MSNIAENIYVQRIHEHTEDQKGISLGNLGFRSSHSKEQQVLWLLENTIKDLNRKIQHTFFSLYPRPSTRVVRLSKDRFGENRWRHLQLGVPKVIKLSTYLWNIYNTTGFKDLLSWDDVGTLRFSYSQMHNCFKITLEKKLAGAQKQESHQNGKGQTLMVRSNRSNLISSYNIFLDWRHLPWKSELVRLGVNIDSGKSSGCTNSHCEIKSLLLDQGCNLLIGR